MNETTELLKDFAKSQGINVKEVDKFLSEYNSPKTLNDLQKVPEGLLEHINYITYVQQPLKSFISNEMWCDRNETVDLETVIDCLYDRVYDLLDEDDDFDLDEVGIENVKADDEEKREKLEEFQAIAKQLVDTKFGSVVYDW